MLSKNEIKYIQSLGHKKSRDAEGVFLAEGVKIATEFIQTLPGAIVRLYATAGFAEKARQKVKPELVTEVTEAELERISQLQTPNQVLIIARQFPDAELNEITNEWILALDTIQDPGNMGTIIRIADWFGIRKIALSEGCADVCNPKVVQASMGSILRIRVKEVDLPGYLSSVQVPVLAAALGGTDVSDYVFPEAGILVIGNEGKGISAEVMKHVTQQISIPSFGAAESLNAAVATGILLWELKRRDKR